ncbi:hypothetical protein FQN60_005694 [Etheostoma spectabile]|uniref:F-box/LRR-repeat protein 15-like leucin rich repeat domain-containing protein n=1 Tax=Etheostoma spectabile TaxID=54343 RepID=A0A5J5CHZ7_9PERO|nr:hypothetical protein FQN60_005694 [Etheostoma spectabile]
MYDRLDPRSAERGRLFVDSSLGRIAQYLKNLEVLELGGCSNITNTGLLLIAWGLHRLKSLNLRSCRHVSDVGIGHLAGMTRSAAEGCLNLEYLTLQDCQKLTDLSLKHISKGLTKLRVLNLSFCGGISDAGMIHLSHMASLWSLNLRSCDNISDTGTMHLAMGTLRLSGLDVSFCDKIGDQTLAYIAQGLYQLKSLSLCSCHISDDGINRMVRQMHELRTLNIGQCVRITDKGLELIADHLTQLAGIDLYGCTKITKRGLERITQLPCLKVLNLGLWQMTESEKTFMFKCFLFLSVGLAGFQLVFDMTKYSAWPAEGLLTTGTERDKKKEDTEETCSSRPVEAGGSPEPSTPSRGSIAQPCWLAGSLAHLQHCYKIALKDNVSFQGAGAAERLCLGLLAQLMLPLSGHGAHTGWTRLKGELEMFV